MTLELTHEQLTQALDAMPCSPSTTVKFEFAADAAWDALRTAGEQHGWINSHMDPLEVQVEQLVKVWARLHNVQVVD